MVTVHISVGEESPLFNAGLSSTTAGEGWETTAGDDDLVVAAVDGSSIGLLSKASSFVEPAGVVSF